MMPRLMAEDRLAQINVGLAIEGKMMEDIPRSNYLGALEQTARGVRHAEDASVASLLQMRVPTADEGEIEHTIEKWLGLDNPEGIYPEEVSNGNSAG